MAAFKAVQLLKTFDRENLKEFEKFLASPFFSTGRDLMPIYLYLKKYHPVYGNEKALEIIVIHKALFPERKTKTDHTRKLLSDLYKQAEKYISVRSFLNDKQAYSIRRIKELNKLETQGLFDKAVSNYRAENIITENFFPHRFFHNSELEEHSQHNLIMNEDFKKYFNVVIRSAEYKLLGTISQLYRVNAVLYTIRKNFNYDPSGSIIDAVPDIISHEKLLGYIQKAYPQYFPFIEIYYYLYLSHNSPGEIKYFRILKEKFYGKISHIEHTEAYNLFKYLEGYLILNRYEIENSAGEIAALCKDMLRYGIYAASGTFMYQVTYQNFCLALLNNGEVDEAESFIRNYTKKLDPKFRKNSMNLMMAHILMKKREFENALGYLSKVKKDVFYTTNTIHSLTIILHYELSYFDSAISHIGAYEKYLRINPEISDSVRGRYLSFARIVKKLIALKYSNDKLGIDEIKRDISGTNPLYKSEWLMEKAGELNKK